MEDIFAFYRQGLLFYGPYRAYFNTPKNQSGEYTPKSHYSREPLSSINSGERERKEQHHETTPTKTSETKIENLQKIENKKETIEQNEISSNEKIGLPEYQQKIEQTDITKRNRSANHYDKSEIGGEV